MNEATLEEIAVTQDSDDPVFEAELPNGSHAKFMFPGNGYIRVHHVVSIETGDMKTLLNEITRHFSMNKVEFFNVLDEHIELEAEDLNREMKKLGSDIELDTDLSMGGDLMGRLRGFRRIDVPIPETEDQEIVVYRGMWDPDKYQK